MREPLSTPAMTPALKVAAIAEASFAVLLGLWALPGGFGGETAPQHLRVGFTGYAACAALVSAAMLWRPRIAAIAGIIFALIYSIPGALTLASTHLWEASADGLARSMLLRFGLALAAQLLALGALLVSRAWERRPPASLHRAPPTA